MHHVQIISAPLVNNYGADYETYLKHYDIYRARVHSARSDAQSRALPAQALHAENRKNAKKSAHEARVKKQAARDPLDLAHHKRLLSRAKNSRRRERRKAKKTEDAKAKVTADLEIAKLLSAQADAEIRQAKASSSVAEANLRKLDSMTKSATKMAHFVAKSTIRPVVDHTKLREKVELLSLPLKPTLTPIDDTTRKSLLNLDYLGNAFPLLVTSEVFGTLVPNAAYQATSDAVMSIRDTIFEQAELRRKHALARAKAALSAQVDNAKKDEDSARNYLAQLNMNISGGQRKPLKITFGQM